jgi:hypothetical protein
MDISRDCDKTAMGFSRPKYYVVIPDEGHLTEICSTDSK